MEIGENDLAYFIDATETGAFYKSVGSIGLILRVYTYETFEGKILELADVLFEGKLETYNTQFFVKIG
jgi:hypothetical protein